MFNETWHKRKCVLKWSSKVDRRTSQSSNGLVGQEMGGISRQKRLQGSCCFAERHYAAFISDYNRQWLVGKVGGALSKDEKTQLGRHIQYSRWFVGAEELVILKIEMDNEQEEQTGNAKHLHQSSYLANESACLPQRQLTRQTLWFFGQRRRASLQKLFCLVATGCYIRR